MKKVIYVLVALMFLVAGCSKPERVIVVTATFAPADIQVEVPTPKPTSTMRPTSTPKVIDSYCPESEALAVGIIFYQEFSKLNDVIQWLGDYYVFGESLTDQMTDVYNAYKTVENLNVPPCLLQTKSEFLDIAEDLLGVIAAIDAGEIELAIYGIEILQPKIIAFSTTFENAMSEVN